MQFFPQVNNSASTILNLPAKRGAITATSRKRSDCVACIVECLISEIIFVNIQEKNARQALFLTNLAREMNDIMIKNEVLINVILIEELWTLTKRYVHY